MAKFTQTLESLRTGLSSVTPVIPTKTTLPVLGNVLIRSLSDDTIQFQGTDLDISIRIKVPAKIDGDVHLTVPAKKLFEIARELPAESIIEFEAKGDKLMLKSGRARFTLNTIPTDEYPALPAIDWDTSTEIKGSTLKEMISHTTYAVSTEESRPILNGVFWDNGENEMAMVATNGHRLAKLTISMNGQQPLPANIIVPPKALALVDKVFGADSLVEVAANANIIGFRTTEIEIIGRLIEGPYPNYQSVIPKDNDKVLVVDRDPFVAALRRMAIVANEQTHRVRLTMAPGHLRLSVETADLGEGNEELEVTYNGEPLEVGFNAQYLLETLKYVPGKTVQMTFKSPERATILTSSDENSKDLPNFKALVMPIRLLD